MIRAESLGKSMILHQEMSNRINDDVTIYDD